MKKKYITLAVLGIFGIVGVGAVSVGALTKTANQPIWVASDGRVDYGKLADNAEVPYTCWNGKNIKLSGKVIKAKNNNHPQVDSTDFKLGVAKTNELRSIPGVVTVDDRGGEVITIDESNPSVYKVMQKYEAKETPQCQ